MRKLSVVTFLLLTIFNTVVLAQTNKDPLKVLFVGNSYTYFENLPQIVSLISEGTDTKLQTKKSTAGGAWLSDHWIGNKGLKTREIIETGGFDMVVIQENSMGAINAPDSTRKYSKLLCDFIKKNGAKPVIYLTWARKMVPQYQEPINNVFSEVVKDNKVMMSPVGKAWALARKMRPGIELFNSDGSHPSELGTFLTACVFVATITKQLPEKLQGYYRTLDLQGETIELMSIHPLDVVFCRMVVEEVCFE